MKKMILKKRKKHKLKIINIILSIIIILILLTHLTLKYINNKISPKLIHYAEQELKKQSKILITESISENELEKLKTEDIYVITKNNNNEILTVDINTITLNKINKTITKKILEKLKKLEQGQLDDNNEENKNGIILKIPLSIIHDNFILNNLGPKIPVKLKILGDIETKVNTNIKNYGINSALIEITLDITVKEEVILPLSTKETIVTQTLPLTIKMIEGKIPNYYSNGINKSEILSIPIE